MPAAAKLNQASILGNADKGFACKRAVLAEMNDVPQNPALFEPRAWDKAKRLDVGRPPKPTCRARP
jgi:hypothetical protein